MYRSKTVIFTVNCILNQNVVVSPLARAEGTYIDIVKTIIDYGIGIHQLPCPEFSHLGLSRKPMSKEEYDTVEFRELCKSLASEAINVIKGYLSEDYSVIGLIGINHSPSCGIYGEKGILIEEIINLAKTQNISIYTIDVPCDYYDGERGKTFIEDLKKFIETHI